MRVTRITTKDICIATNKHTATNFWITDNLELIKNRAKRKRENRVKTNTRLFLNVRCKQKYGALRASREHYWPS